MLLAFNKPYGVLTQFTVKGPGQRTLAEFGFPKDVYPLGRLDMDSEGLLFLSDEKGWTERLMHPQNAHERTYHVQVEGLMTDESLAKLRKGIVIQDWKTRPCKAEYLPHPSYPERKPPIRFRKLIPTSWIEVKLIEGKNRQVRKMTASVGFPTLRLIRVAIGGYALLGLAEGKWCELNAQDKQQLLRSRPL